MDVQENRRANLLAWVTAAGGYAKVAAKHKLKPSTASYLSAIVNGYAIGERSARNWEVRLGMRPNYLDTPSAGALDRNPSPIGGPPNAGQVAHKVSLPIETVAPTITWEQLMTTDTLPPEFHLVLTDDAMAPTAGTGTKVKFRRTDQASAGDAVLVADNQGGVYFRERHAGLHGQWEARATHPAYPSLNSATHGLRVLAVFTGIDTPWSALMR